MAREKLLYKKIHGISKNNSIIHNHLVNIALVPFKRMMVNHKEKITFYQASYLYKIVNIIEIQTKKTAIEYDESLLKQRLIHINFNSISFLNYLITEIKNEISEMDSTKGQVEKLYWYLKNLNQTHVKPGYIFNPAQKGIKEFITDWIIEEIIFLEKKLLLSSPYGNNPQLLDPNFKLITCLSVPQIACFIRLLVESGIIKNKNKKELINFSAMLFQSKRQENISAESLRTKFYNIEESARQEVKNLIIQLLNQINKL